MSLEKSLMEIAKNISHAALYLQRAGMAGTIPELLHELNEEVEQMRQSSLALKDAIWDSLADPS